MEPSDSALFFLNKLGVHLELMSKPVDSNFMEPLSFEEVA